MPTKAQRKTSNQTVSDMQQCIANCLECYTICLQTITYSLQQGGKHADPIHLQFLMDSAEICQTSANFMLRGSEQHKLTCAICAEVCQLCADSCSELSEKDKQMALCAEVCDRCAQSCRQMAA